MSYTVVTRDSPSSGVEIIPGKSQISCRFVSTLGFWVGVGALSQHLPLLVLVSDERDDGLVKVI